MMNRMNRSTLVAVAFAVGLVAAGQSEASLNARSIHVNGQRMGPAEIAALDHLNCGEAVPSGRYWVNWGTRAWGYEGGRRQGWLPNCQRQATARTPKRFVEDRVFERHGVDMIHMPTYR
jgi:hypothetical protein